MAIENDNEFRFYQVASSPSQQHKHLSKQECSNNRQKWVENVWSGPCPSVDHV